MKHYRYQKSYFLHLANMICKATMFSFQLTANKTKQQLIRLFLSMPTTIIVKEYLKFVILREIRSYINFSTVRLSLQLCEI